VWFFNRGGLAMSFLSFFPFPRSAANRPASPRPRLRPGVEVLEGRSLPSTTSLVVGGHSHLQAVAEQNEVQVEHGTQVEVQHQHRGPDERMAGRAEMQPGQEAVHHHRQNRRGRQDQGDAQGQGAGQTQPPAGTAPAGAPSPRRDEHGAGQDQQDDHGVDQNNNGADQDQNDDRGVDQNDNDDQAVGQDQNGGHGGDNGDHGGDNGGHGGDNGGHRDNGSDG
jgi:hypothetical protein